MAQLNNTRRNGPVEFRIVEHLGVLELTKNGWAKEVNVVEWNGNPAKIDIREWDQDHNRMSRGVTLHEKEAIRLADVLNRRYSSVDTRVRLDRSDMSGERRDGWREEPERQEQFEQRGASEARSGGGFSDPGLDAGPLVDSYEDANDRNESPASDNNEEELNIDEPFTRATASDGTELMEEAV